MKTSIVVALIAALTFTAGCKKREEVEPISVGAPVSQTTPAQPVAVRADPLPMAELFRNIQNAPTTHVWCINGTTWMTAGNNQWVQMLEVGPQGAEPVSCTGGIVFSVPK